MIKRKKMEIAKTDGWKVYLPLEESKPKAEEIYL